MILSKRSVLTLKIFLLTLVLLCNFGRFGIFTFNMYSGRGDFPIVFLYYVDRYEEASTSTLGGLNRFFFLLPSTVEKFCSGKSVKSVHLTLKTGPSYEC
jgi:hypothetical protein